MATKIRGNSQIMTGTVDVSKLKSNLLEDIALTGGVHVWQLTSDNSGILRGLADPHSHKTLQLKHMLTLLLQVST